MIRIHSLAVLVITVTVSGQTSVSHIAAAQAMRLKMRSAVASTSAEWGGKSVGPRSAAKQA